MEKTFTVLDIGSERPVKLPQFKLCGRLQAFFLLEGRIKIRFGPLMLKYTPISCKTLLSC